MLFAGSRASVRPKALQSTDLYEGARGDVLHYDESKGRYAIELIHPKFCRKRMLLKGEALEFHHALLHDNLSAAKAELQTRPIAFRYCTDFEATFGFGTSAGPSIGHALVATQSLGEGDLVLTDAPFLVVSNPAGLERWMRRWDCCYEVIKRAQVGSRDLLEAFEALDPGSEEVVESLVPDAEETVKILWFAAGAGAPSPPEAAKRAEVRRIATLLARWQTNQHELGGDDRRALYWLAPKVAHSCDPNVGWEDPDACGQVELRCLRPVEAGDVLGVNYMDVAFLAAPVGERRRRLQAERKFCCLCCRCLREERLGAVAPKEAETSCSIVGANLHPHIVSVREGLSADNAPSSLPITPSTRTDSASKTSLFTVGAGNISDTRANDCFEQLHADGVCLESESAQDELSALRSALAAAVSVLASVGHLAPSARQLEDPSALSAAAAELQRRGFRDHLATPFNDLCDDFCSKLRAAGMEKLSNSQSEVQTDSNRVRSTIDCQMFDQDKCNGAMFDSLD